MSADDTSGRRTTRAVQWRALALSVALASLGALTSLGALAATAAAQDDAGAWARIEAPLVLEWPRDHGAHDAFRTEWWYATGEVADESSHAFGFQLTIFRHGLDPHPPAAGASNLRARQVFAAHLALIDIDAGATRFAQRIRRAGAGLAQADPADLAAWVEDWEMRRAPSGELTLRARDREQGLGLELTLAARKPFVLHGADGSSHKGPEPGNASAYMSWTRMDVRGALSFAGVPHTVHGTAWFDHEWGSTQLGLGVVGWDWFGLRLDDGRELMLYRLRTADGSASAQSAATLVEADGSARSLSRSDFELTTDTRWKSPRSGALYPARTKLSIPSAALVLTLTPLVEDCELDARLSTGTSYWEGPVRVEGSVKGRGYAELTGYASSLAGRF